MADEKQTVECTRIGDEWRARWFYFHGAGQSMAEALLNLGALLHRRDRDIEQRHKEPADG